MTGKPRKDVTVEDYLAHVMGGGVEYTSAECAELAGVDPAWARKLWRAMGFADVGGERAFTKADVDALKTVQKLIDRGLFSVDDALEIVRSLGQGTARLAEWQGATVGRVMAERGLITEGGPLTSKELPAVVRESKQMKPSLEKLMVYAWRRQIAASIMRAAAMNPGSDAATNHMSVGFADLVGFTRLSRQIADNELGALVHTFETVSADIIAGGGARMVKTLGDEVLFVDPSVTTIAETALRLHEMSASLDNFPKLRIGISTGSVVQRMGDVFGTTVNRASRLTAMAKPATTYLDSETMELLSGNDAFSIKSVRPRAARGFGFMRSWAMTGAKS